MTEEQLGLARRLVACEEWRWVPGMLDKYGIRYLGGEADGQMAWADSVDTGATVRYVWPEHLTVTPFLPDISDYATAAILLRMAMENMYEADCYIEGDKDGAPEFVWAFDFGKDIKDAVQYLTMAPDLGTAAGRALLVVWEYDAK